MEGFFIDTCVVHVLPSPTRAGALFLTYRLGMPLAFPQVVDGKFLDPKMPRAEMDKEYQSTVDEIEAAFQTLSEV